MPLMSTPSQTQKADSHSPLRTADLRTLNFYLWYFKGSERANNEIRSAPYPMDNASNLRHILKKFFDAELDEYKIDHNKELMSFVAINLLPEQRFNWLRENKSACAFTWGYIKKMGQ